MKHTNVDALSRNPVGKAQDDDDFCEEIRDISTGGGDSVALTVGMLSVQCGRRSEWLGLRRQSVGVKQHHEYCFGINHRQWPEMQQLCMLEVLTDEEGDSPDEGSEAARDDGILRSESSRNKQITSRGGTRYYNKEQQLELVLAAQGLVYEDAHQASDTTPYTTSALHRSGRSAMGWPKG
ncbi:unnamed protein product [Sphagnum balticum]